MVRSRPSSNHLNGKNDDKPLGFGNTHQILPKYWREMLYWYINWRLSDLKHYPSQWDMRLEWLEQDQQDARGLNGFFVECWLWLIPLPWFSMPPARNPPRWKGSNSQLWGRIQGWMDDGNCSYLLVDRPKKWCLQPNHMDQFYSWPDLMMNNIFGVSIHAIVKLYVIN